MLKKLNLFYIFVVIVGLMFVGETISKAENYLVKGFFDEELPTNKSQGRLQWESTKYNTSLTDQPQLNQSTLMLASIKSEFTKKPYKTYLDVQVGRFIDTDLSYFGVQQIYFSQSFQGESLQISFGRKINDWSFLDKEWQLGFWEPKYTRDGINPINQGLTGVFVEYRKDNFNFLFYATPLFIPTMGPNVKEDQGKIVADSRWYLRPSPESPVLGRNTHVYYSIRLEKLEDLIKKQGLGLRLKVNPFPNFWVSTNYAAKPINSLLTKYDAKLAVNTAFSEGKVVISPSVGYHHLWGLDVGTGDQENALVLSYLSEEPQLQNPVNRTDFEDWVLQQPEPVRAASLTWKRRWDIDSFGKWIRPFGVVETTFSYLQLNGGLIHDVDSEGIERSSLFPYRFNFYRALSASIQWPFSAFGKKASTYFRWLKDFEQEGTLWQLSTQIQLNSDWVALLGLDILGPDQDNPSDSDLRFLNQYRANDRFYGALQYVF